MNLDTLPAEIRSAVEAAQEKQALDVVVMKLPSAFAEYFLLASGQSAPQILAIARAIEERLDRERLRLIHREGKSGAEWLLLDYGFFVVHVFSQPARQYYDLERLWRNAERFDFPPPEAPAGQRDESQNGAIQP